MANYYADQTLGLDTNNGLSPTAPWKTINKVNTSSFNAGDSILFKRVELWREQLTVPSSGSAGFPITFGAYGTEEKPIINGADVITGWTPEIIKNNTPTNLLANTEDFDSWSKVNVTVTVDDITDPFGTTTADAICPTAIEHEHKVEQFVGVTIGSTYVYSIYFKKGTKNWVWVRATYLNASYGLIREDSCFVNLDTGAKGTEAGTATWTVIPAANGFYRVIGITLVPALTAYTSWNFRTAQGNEDAWYLGTTEKEIYAACARLELSDSVNDYGFTGYYKAATTEPYQVFEDNVRMTKVASTAAMTIDSFFWGTNVLHIRTSGDDNPSGYIIEASQRTGISATAKDYITIDGLSLTKSNNYSIFVGAGTDYLIVQNCDISWDYMYGILAWSAAVDSINGLIKGNTISYAGGSGIQLADNTVTWTVENNIVHNNCCLEIEAVEHNYTAGIKINGESGIIVQNNTVYSNGIGRTGDRGSGIWVDTGVDGTIFRYNKCYGNNFHGLFVEISHDCQVCYNISYGNVGNAYTSGIAVSGHATSAEDNLVYNNVCYNNGFAGMFVNGDGGNNKVKNNIVKNNISIGNAIRQLFACGGGENDGTMGSGNVYLNNCFGPESSNFIEWGHSTYKSTYDAWEVAYGSSTYSVESDPLFIDPDDENFRLQPTSPCRDVGVDVGLTEDYEGNTVPWGMGVDIGAFEYWEEIIEQEKLRRKKLRRKREEAALITATCFPINPY